MIVLYILLALLAFGILIFIHEAGHYIFARLFNVTIKEFSIGMGPKLISKKSSKTNINYSLRAFPIGGYLSMAGEDEVSNDPNAFNIKPIWQRIIIILAGAVTNLFVGFLVMVILVCSSSVLGSTTIAAFDDNSKTEESGLEVNDQIISINGTKVHTADELVYEIMRFGIEPCDVSVLRNGTIITISNVEFPQSSSNGVSFGDIDFHVYSEMKTIPNLFKHSVYRSAYTVRMIWESMYDLMTGRYSLGAVSGPIGATQALTQAASFGGYSFISLAVVISINLGVMNLLPFPALDGGKIVLLIVEFFRKKPISNKIENYINLGGFSVLILLMLVVCINDIIKLF